MGNTNGNNMNNGTNDNTDKNTDKSFDDMDFDFLADEQEGESPENESLSVDAHNNYKVIVADDDESVHAVTNLILKEFRFENKGLTILNTYSGNETKTVLEANPDVAVILLDVVMEDLDSGLKVVEYIRNDLRYHNTRIILRTGQPGQAPENYVIKNYDINDYVLKTELTNNKLFTLMYSCLRSYRDIITTKETMESLAAAENELRKNYLNLKHEVKRRRKAESELMQTNEKLKEMDRLKMEFLAVISNEFRSPLTSIFGFSNIIKKKFDEVFSTFSNGKISNDKNKMIAQVYKQLNDNISKIQSEGQKMTLLVNDVMDITKLELGKEEWHNDELNIADIIDGVIEITELFFIDNKLQLVKDIQDELPVFIGDRKKLIRVLHEFISNAVKFTREGIITCQAQLIQDDTIQVSVTDTGIGIDRHNLEVVFEKYKKLHNSNILNKPAGAGLGLSICKEIIEKHGGKIWAESSPGRGSTFYFTLPCRNK